MANFTLDKHKNRELTLFNMLGSGLFEKFDTLYLRVTDNGGKAISCTLDAIAFTLNHIWLQDHGAPIPYPEMEEEDSQMAILRLSQTGTWFICLFLFKLLLVFNSGFFLPFTVLLT